MSLFDKQFLKIFILSARNDEGARISGDILRRSRLFFFQLRTWFLFLLLTSKEKETTCKFTV